MREIKFRAWNIKTKVMFYVAEMSWLVGGFYITDGAVFSGFVEDNFIIMQFTGLKDKNGKEIYEGDVVKYTYLPGKTFWNFDGIGIVSWQSTGFHLGVLENMGGVSAWLVSLPGLGASEKPNELLEIIGNIYENPELLRS